MEQTFWFQGDFLISTFLSLLGMFLTIMSFVQAKKAKEAAESATRVVKMQTMTMELSEIIQKLDKLPRNVDFSTARELHNETSRKVRRLLAPLKSESEYEVVINDIYVLFEEIREALLNVRPIGHEIVQYAVYNAIEHDLTKLSGLLADLLGLVEKRTINLK